MLLGTIQSFLRIDTGQFNTGLNEAQRNAARQGGLIGKAFKSIGDDVKDALKVAVGAFAVTKIASFFGDTIKAASDLQESTNKVSQVFKSAAPAVLDFAATTAKSFGISNVEARNAAATFGVFGQSAGLAGKDLSDFSIKLVGMAADFASFHNTSPEDAIIAIGSALRGESEPIRAYGVLLNEMTLRTEGVKLGLIATTKQALTPQQRVLTAYNVILEQTTFAQGDFAKTSQFLANQMRITSASFEDTKAAIGQALLPTATQFFGAVQTIGLPALQALGTALSGVLSVLGPFIVILGDLINIVGDLPTPILAGAAAWGLWLLLRGPILVALDQIGIAITRVAFAGASLAVQLSLASGVLAKTAVVARIAGTSILTAFGGIAGIAITGLVIGLGYLFSSLTETADGSDAAAEAQKQHQDAVENITQSLDAETGALTKATRAQIIDKLEKQGALKALQDLGINTEQYVDAILKVGGAQPAVTKALRDQAKAALESSKSFQDLKPQLDAAGVSTDDFLDALTKGDLSVIAGQLDQTGKGATGAATGLDDMAIGAAAINESNISNTMDGLVAAAGPAAGLMQTLGATTGETADALDSGARKVEAMGEGALDASGKITNLDGVVDDTTKSVTPFKQALDESKKSADKVGDSIDFLKQKLEDLRNGIDEAAKTQRGADAAYRDAGQAALDYASSQDKVVQAQIDVNKATEDLKDAQDHLGKSQEDGGTTADDVTEAELKLAQAQRDQKKATTDVTAAADDQADSYDTVRDKAREMAGAAYQNQAANGDLEAAVRDANAVMQTQRDRFIAAQVAAGMEEGAARTLADQIGLIPGDVTTAYTAPGSPYAIAQAADLKTKLDAVPGRKDVTINTNASSVVADLDGVQRVINNITGKTVTITTERREIVRGTVTATAATGGQIRGPGTMTSDSIPAMLSDYEIVIRAIRAKRYASQLLALNAGMDPAYIDWGKAKGFAAGGQAGSRPIFTSQPVQSQRPQVVVMPTQGSSNTLVIEFRGDGVLRQVFQETARMVVEDNQSRQAQQLQFMR